MPPPTGCAACCCAHPSLAGSLCVNYESSSIHPHLLLSLSNNHHLSLKVSYLEAKHMLLLSYCINIVFYLLLKARCTKATQTRPSTLGPVA